MITELEFKSLAAQGYNRIPLLTEAFADLETPLSLYLKLAYADGGGKHSFLLESVVGGERFGRYSFIGLPARTLLRASGFKTEVVTDGVVVETHEGNPLDFIAQYQARFKVALRPGLPRFCGGLAGYFGYDAVRYIEPKLAKTWKDGGIDTPDILLLQCEELAVIDNLSGRLYLIVYADPGQAESYFHAKRRLSELADKLRAFGFHAVEVDGRGARVVPLANDDVHAQPVAEHGFGALELSRLSERGGTATMLRSHYAMGWRSRWGVRTTPACYFPTGYLAGAVAIASKLAPERVTAVETECHAAGAAHCSFLVEVW